MAGPNVLTWWYVVLLCRPESAHGVYWPSGACRVLCALPGRQHHFSQPERYVAASLNAPSRSGAAWRAATALTGSAADSG